MIVYLFARIWPQFIYSILYGLSAIVMAFSGLGTKFLTYDVDYWCERPNGLNVSVDNWLNMSAPFLDESRTDFDR